LFGTLKFTYREGESVARESQLGCGLEEEIPPEGLWGRGPLEIMFIFALSLACKINKLIYKICRQ